MRTPQPAAIKDFNVAFPSLVGNDTEIAANDIRAFAEFALEITYPPNPIRALDNEPTAASGDATMAELICCAPEPWSPRPAPSATSSSKA